MRKRILFIAAAITAAIMIVLSYGCAVPDENAHTDNGAYTDGYGDTAPVMARNGRRRIIRIKIIRIKTIRRLRPIRTRRSPTERGVIPRGAI